MSETQRRAEAAKVRLAEYNEELLRCLREGRARGPKADEAFDEELGWRLIENQVQLWAIDPVLPIEQADLRRHRAEKIADAASQARTLLAAALTNRPNGFYSETGGELIRAYLGAEPEAAMPISAEEWEHGFQALQRIASDLERVEAAAAFVAHRHPSKGRGRQAGSGNLPPDHVEWFGWAWGAITGLQWSAREGDPFVEFVAIVGEAIGLPPGYDVREAINRARPDYKAPPSRRPEYRRRKAAE